MAETTTLARPYAKAAFEVAKQDNALDQWSKELALASAVAQQPSVSNVLRDPSLSAQQIASAFIDVCRDGLNEKGQNLIRLLAENKRLVLLPEVSALYEILKADQEKSVDVEITAAFKISSEVSQKLANALRSRLEREINLVTKVDQSLIGGAVIRAGDMVIDSSVFGKLTKLAESMKS
ncbi:MAG: F0F1 ATP synthase subunit delta [Gammaproteobacteria bacterium]|nr:F0F1 ATP synthase subunit delta [Gammaproteobacteria bacterium]|tara:strand:- start:1310 stop:1846 length:537 start_codon:yes stop_codon:yes gene_type:complete